MLSRRLGLVRSAAAAALPASELHTTAASADKFKKWRNSDSSSRAAADTGKFRQWRHRNIDGPTSSASKGRMPGVMAPWRALSRAENQEIDRFAIEELAMPSLLLMENAGMFEWLCVHPNFGIVSLPQHALHAMEHALLGTPAHCTMGCWLTLANARDGLPDSRLEGSG